MKASNDCRWAGHVLVRRSRFRIGLLTPRRCDSLLFGCSMAEG
jgi:hypothetical protein